MGKLEDFGVIFGQNEIIKILKEIETKQIGRKSIAYLPIFSLYYVKQDGSKKQFTNFYGTKINLKKNFNPKKIISNVQENDAEIFAMIDQLEMVIKNYNFQDISDELFVDLKMVNLSELTQNISDDLEDANNCLSFSSALDSFINKYVNDKKHKQIETNSHVI